MHAQYTFFYNFFLIELSKRQYEIILYIQVGKSVFQHEVAQKACHSACEHIAKSLLNFMTSDDVKSISPGALQQINLDTIQCERQYSHVFCIYSVLYVVKTYVA